MQNARALALRSELAQIEKAEQQKEFRERVRRYREVCDERDRQEKLVQEIDREVGEIRRAQSQQAPFVRRAREALREFETLVLENDEAAFRTEAEIGADDARRRELQQALDVEVDKAAELGRQHANLFCANGPWFTARERLTQLSRQAEELRPTPRRKEPGSGLFYVA